MELFLLCSYLCFFYVVIWAGTQDFSMYSIGEQQRLQQACANSPSCQSLSSLHKQSTVVDKESGQTLKPVALLDTSELASEHML